MPIYAEHGVHHAWLVDPAAQLAEVYRLESGNWLRLGTWRGHARVRAEPFDAIELDLGSLCKP
jgi:Uma2 family endonuclease